MKLSAFFAPSIASLAAFAALPAMAQSFPGEFEGAELSYRFTETNEDYGYEQFVASVGLNFGSVTTQFDIGGGGYDGEGFGDPRLWTLHLGYMAPAGFEVGVFYGQENWNGSGGDPYPYYGIEGAYASGPIEVTAAYGIYENNTSSDIYYHFLTVDGAYAFNSNWSALGHLTLTGNSDYYDEFTILGLGAQYETGSGFYVQANYHNMSGEYDQDIIEIKLGYEFGAGATYDNRGWNDVLITY